jgi:hypothetical protein
VHEHYRRILAKYVEGDLAAGEPGAGDARRWDHSSVKGAQAFLSISRTSFGAHALTRVNAGANRRRRSGLKALWRLC